MSGAHADIAPSALATIVACHAHVQMAAPYRNEPPTPESLEGDAAHWVNATAAVYGIDSILILPGTITPQGIPVDDDMLAGARLWLASCGLHGQTEIPVICERIHPTKCWGTPDWWRYDPIDMVLRVNDYKYGHKFVEVFECWQLIAYAVGLLDMLALDDQLVRVVFTIVQPRSYHPEGPVRVWECDAADLRPLANRANMAAEASLLPNPVATTGVHCEFCPGRHECRTLQLAGLALADFSGTMDRVNLPPDAVGTELRILDAAAVLLEARRTGLQQQAEAMLRRGQRVPGYGLTSKPGRLKWKAPPAEVITMGDLLGIQLRKPIEPITPTQAIAAGLDEAVISGQYAERPKGPMTLTPDTTTQARKVFGANAT